MTKTKKLLSIILSILMIVTTMPMAFAADATGTDAKASLTNGENVTYYATLAEAITAAQSATGSTVQLLDSVTLSNTIEINAGQFTIDLNGKKVTFENDIAFSITRGPLATEGANVTITSTVSGGEIEAGLCVRVDSKCTAKVTGVTLHCMQSSGAAAISNGTGTLTLENVTVTSENGGVDASVGSSNVTILGNSSISGAEYDVACNTSSTITLGEGVTFPDGLTAYSDSGDKALNTMLADGMAYWQGDNKMIQLTSDTYEITGTVTVKAVCTHENEEEFTYTANTDGTTHVKAYQCCGAVVEAAEAHSGGEATCVKGKICEICDGEYGEIDSTNHNFVNGTCSDCGKVKDIIGSLSSQIRFQRNADGSYADKFDVRTRAMISDEDFTSLVGSTNDEAAKNIKKVGFVYSINPETFSTEDAKTVAMGGEVSGYVDAPVSYIQDADGYYMFTCLVKNIPSTDTNYTLVSYAYICVEDENGNEKWYFMDTQAEADFYSLYSTYYPVACEKYGW